MRFLLGIAIILSGLAIGCRRSEAPPLAMPAEADPTPFDVPDFAVWRPFFFTAAGDHSTSEIIGTAFAIRFAEQGGQFLVTTESILLGAIAIRYPETKLQWDAANMRFTNNDDANRWLTRDYREGWDLKALIG